MMNILEKPVSAPAEMKRNRRLTDPLRENWNRLYRLRHELDLLLDELRTEVVRLNNRP
ncbi:hypothetical protein [Gorillibacterium sp. sgz5001074]|uniref:hypothetical protein n=1 Tax=Gorillibacterium sp. sgz5001074 TaxID=3446695 RepID=UPI003F67CF13